MRWILAVLFLLALPASARAQTTLDGAWTLTFMMQDGSVTAMPLHAEVVEDTLRLAIKSDDHGERAMEEVSFDDGVLNFVLPTGHGSVRCVLYREEGKQDFSGLCEGPMGEVPSTLTRNE